MASERQLRANRLNAKKSTGPKSRAGKKRAGQNAYTHGLRAAVLPNCDWMARLEALAHEIVDSTGGQISIDQARAIAQAQLEVCRVRSISTAVVTQILASGEQSSRSHAADRSGQRPLLESEPERRAEASGGPQFSVLKVLDRYQSRAVARRDKLLQQIFLGCLH
jgi:hypothetical protein